MGGDLQIDDGRQVRHSDAQQGRAHECGDAAHPTVGPGFPHWLPAPGHTRQHAQPTQRSHLQAQLQHPAAEHAHDHGIDWLDAHFPEPVRPQPCGSDHRQIQQHRSEGRHGELFPGVENTGAQRHQGHEADVGEHPARHHHGGVKAARVLLQAAGQQPHQGGRGQHTNEAGQQQHPGQHGGHPIHQNMGGGIAVLHLAGTQHGHKGLAERAFAEQAAEHVGQAKRHVEGVGHGGGAKHRGHDQVPHHAGDA